MAGSILEKSAERERLRESEQATDRVRDAERAGELDRNPPRRPEDNWGYGSGPFSLMRRFSDDVDRFFGSAFGSSALHRAGSSGTWTPVVDVRQRDNMVEVVAELPGMKRDDIKVECTDEGIILEGDKREERVETRGGIHHSERSYGHFYRLIPLPAGADPEKATADFRDGLLQIKVPVQEGRQRRRSIPIQT